ncbi:bifunctional diguanylate cyclase/phosphodiesterase [Fulvimarina sp. MAC8]|uniref:putative bifunctional diguanylate cyclase/phosphodiesterase n=1 Tax=Fulvimarina sp. MAC8 TaxID=3162874 RepID=UPI0032EE23CB
MSNREGQPIQSGVASKARANRSFAGPFGFLSRLTMKRAAPGRFSRIKSFLDRDRLLCLVIAAIIALSALAAQIFMENQKRVENVAEKFDTRTSDRLINDAFRLTLAVQHDVLNPTEALSDAAGIYDQLRNRISQIKLEAASRGLKSYYRHLKKDIEALEPLIELRLVESNSIEVFENVYRVAADALHFNSLYNDEAHDAVAAEQQNLESSFLAVGAIVVIAIFLCTLLVWRIVIQNRRLARAVGLDGLTGIHNRVGFDRHVEGLPEETECAIVLFDLDKFKSINDGLGHHAGDELLRTVAHRLTEICQGGEFACRIGGDEFAVVLTGSASVASGEVLCRHILQSIAVPIMIGEETLNISASVGISELPAKAGTDIATLMRQADTALYAAKDAGRGRYRVYSAALVSKTERAEKLQADLADAMKDGQIYVVYQPIICLKTGRTLGFESLARWNHPELGEIPSTEFIPIAEKYGIIADLGRFVLEETCRNAAAWPEHYCAAINVSPSELSDPCFLKPVSRTVARYGISPNRMEFEITESLLVQNEQEALKTIEALRERGFSVALDDFGTGYSSLSYIHRFPFDKIKIDRSFVVEGEINERAGAIVSLICNFARSFGIKAVAEGIETLGQAERMREHGCDMGQGFLYERPLSAEAVKDLIREESEAAEIRWETVRLRLIEKAA